MLALLLVAALSQPAPQPVPPPVTVDFGAAGQVSVPRPGKMGDFEPTDKTYLSPRGDAAAVQFCWDMLPTMVPLMCQVNLVRPGGQILDLKNGAVGPLLWTPDGKYLIGAGNNTMRLWNLVGGVRTHAPKPPNNEKGFIAQTNRIQRIWFEDKFLWVNALCRGLQIVGGQFCAPTFHDQPLRPAHT